jgi:chorismate mutase
LGSSRLPDVVDESSDPVISQFREQISDNDRALVEALNKRLRLVARLKDYKESRGVGFVDVAREEWILQDLARANRGPVSTEGLREFYGAIFDLTKREVSGPEPGESSA